MTIIPGRMHIILTDPTGGLFMIGLRLNTALKLSIRLQHYDWNMFGETQQEYKSDDECNDEQFHFFLSLDSQDETKVSF